MNQQLILKRLIQDVENGKDVPVDLLEIIKSRALLQANSGGGKSHIIRKFCEKSHGKVQQIIIDVEDEFHTLREKYEYLLVGTGPQADIQVDTKHAALLAERLMETGANTIISIYELSPSDRVKFVKIFINAIMNLPKKFWHMCLIIIDEIHKFAPESKSGSAESLEAVASLASAGRKRGYALVGATQRISKLNKDVAAELNTKFIGRCSLDVDRKRAGEELGFKDTIKLRKLKHEFYCYGPAVSDDTLKVKAGPTETSHEEIGSTKQYNPVNKSKINSLMKNFSELPQEVELDLKTKHGLQQKIRELENKLRVAQKAQPVIKNDTGALNKAWKSGFDEATARFKENEKILKDRILKLENNIRWKVKKLLHTVTWLGTISNNNQEILDELTAVVDDKPQLMDLKDAKKAIEEENTKPGHAAIVVSSPTTESGPSVSITIDSEIKISDREKSYLIALAQANKPISRKRMVLVAGYSIKSSGIKDSISKFYKNGLVNKVGQDLEITQEGIEFLGDYEKIPDDLPSKIQHWKGQLKKGPSSFLQVLYDQNGEPIQRDDLATKAGYSPTSSGIKDIISELNTKGLIEKTSEGIILSEELTS